MVTNKDLEKKVGLFNGKELPLGQMILSGYATRNL